MAADSGSRGRIGARMMMHLGVIDQPYRSRSKKVRAITTFDVAKILEAKYGLFSAFYRVHQKDVGNAMADSVAGALESLLMGQRVAPFDRGFNRIRTSFHDFLSTREAERVGIPGTPTQAAIRGVNHRLAHPYRSGNPRRPSFIDTGMLQNSFDVWIDS